MDEKLKEKLKDVDAYIKDTEEKLNAAETTAEVLHIWWEIYDVINNSNTYGLSESDQYKLNQLKDNASRKEKEIFNAKSGINVSNKESEGEIFSDEELGETDFVDYEENEPEERVDTVEVDFEPDEEEEEFKGTEEPEKENEEIITIVKPKLKKKETENKENLKVQAKEDSKDKKITELLVELAKTQATKNMLTFARNKKEMQAAIDDKTGKLKTYLENQAKLYGANKEKIAEIVKEYEENLNLEVQEAEDKLISDTKEIKNQQEEEKNKTEKLKDYKKTYMKDYRDTKSEYGSLAKNYARAVKKRDKEEIKNLEKRREELEYLLTSYESDISEMKKEIKTARETQKQIKKDMKETKKKAKEKLTRNKVNEIIEENTGKEGSDKAIVKQSAFGKFIGFMSGIQKKIGGDSAFKKKVLNPIGDAVKGMTEKAKSIPGNVKKKGKEIIEELKTDMQVKIMQNNEKISGLENTNEVSKDEGFTIDD